MATFPINYWAVLAAAVAKFVLGALWYSPLLFGKSWMQLTGVSDAQMKAALPKGMIADLVGSLVMAFVLAHAVLFAGAHGFGSGLLAGFACWLGFIGLTTLSANVYENRPVALYLLNNAYLLLALLLMGVILALWT